MGKKARVREERSEARQKVAQMRQAERRRERRIQALIFGGISVVIVGIIGSAVLYSQANAPLSGSVTDDAALPKSVYAANAEYPFGVPYGTAKDDANVPVIEAWEDFQCPGCAQLERITMPVLTDLADQGAIKLVWRAATFLDDRNTTPGTRNSSSRAASAWGCALDAGKGAEFHAAVFAAQPATEGVGWTDEQLIEIGKQVGITDAGFATCVTEGRYLDWAVTSNDLFVRSGLNATPAVILNGRKLESTEIYDPNALAAAIQAAADAMAKPAPSASPTK